MSNELRELGDVAAIVMGLSPKGESYNREGVGLPLLNGPTNFGASHPNCTLYTTDSKRECERNDLIFCVRGNTTGRMNWADRKYSLGRGVCGIRAETRRDTKYIRYCIEAGLPRLLQMAGGSTMPTLTQSTIKRFQVPYPPHRGKIAAILSAYDDLIENNLRRIEILEEMAQALYREWFVKFRFPGHESVCMVDSELGMIPEGWEVLPIGDAVKTLGGGTPSTKVPEYWESDGIIWFTPSDLTTSGTMFIEDSRRRISALGLQKSAARLFPAYSVMMTSRATIGVTAINTKPACTNQGFITCVPNSRISAYQLYFWVQENREKILSVASGATYKEINRTEFREFPVAMADRQINQLLADMTAPIGSQIENLLTKNANLRRTRDLPCPG